METTRASEMPRTTSVEGGRSTRRAESSDGAAAAAPQDAFSALLASLGGESMVDGQALMVMDEVPAEPLAEEAELLTDQGAALWLPHSGMVQDPGSYAQAGPTSQAVLDAMSALGAANLPGGLPAQATAARGGGFTAAASMADGLLGGALVAQTAQMDTTLSEPTASYGMASAHRPAFARGAAGAPRTAATDTVGGLSANALKGLAAEKKAVVASGAAAPLQATNQVVGSEKTGAMALPQDMRRVSTGTEAALTTPVLQAVAGALAEMSAQARQGGRTAEGIAAASDAALALDGGNGAFAESLGLAADAAPAGADGAAMAGGEAVQAEPVAFWVNQKTQNAELTLDRDGQPVEVRVSLTGNEAHVTFRSDQAQTREALDASLAQLRDLLQSEGLVLAGVTVGSSGAQDDGRHGAQPGRQGAKPGRVVAAQAGAAEGVMRGNPAGSGGQRTVDIFV